MASHLGTRKKNGRKQTQVKDLPTKLQLDGDGQHRDRSRHHKWSTWRDRSFWIQRSHHACQQAAGIGQICYSNSTCRNNISCQVSTLRRKVHATHHSTPSIPHDRCIHTYYAFTDYRPQGQTIPYVLVDIAERNSQSVQFVRSTFTELGAGNDPFTERL